MNSSMDLQISVECWFSVFSFLAFFCMIIGKEEKTKSCKMLMLVQLSNALYMLFDSFAWRYDGAKTATEFTLLQVFDCVTYVAQFTLTFTMALFVRARIIDSAQNGRRNRWIIFCALVYLVAVGMTIANVWTGWFYYFDEEHVYQRGNLFLLSQGIGFVIIITFLIAVICYKKYIPRVTAWSIYGFVFLPVVAMIVQILNYGLSLIGLATTISAMLLFVAYEIDIAKKLDKENKERMKELIYKQ